MEKNYKEIIYLNNVELNSTLSQLNQGLVESLIRTNSNSKTTEDKTNRNSQVNAGLKFFGINVGNSKGSTEQLSNLFGEEKNIVLNDFKLNSLLDELKERKKLKKLSKSEEGSFVLSKNQFNLSDFNFSKSIFGGPNRSTLNPILKNFMKDINAWDKEAQQGLKFLNHYVQYADSLSKGNIILSMPGLASFVERSNFRINSAELQTLEYTKRPINIFGIVEAIMSKDADQVNDDIQNTFSDENTNQQQSISSVGEMVPKLTELTFLTTGLIKKDDRFIRPIALFFD